MNIERSWSANQLQCRTVKKTVALLNENNPSYLSKSGDGLFFAFVTEDFIAQTNQRNGKATKTKDGLHNFKRSQKCSPFPSDFDELPIGITSFFQDLGATVFTFLPLNYTI